MEKERLRKLTLNQLNNLSKESKDDVMDDCLRQLKKSSEWKNAQRIGITYSMPNELPTHKIITSAIDEGKQIFLPKCLPGYKMQFLPFHRHDQLIQSKFGVFEPQTMATINNKDLDLLIVPGLRFALDSGMRIGFGGGYYDRLLADFSNATVALTADIMCSQTADWTIELFDQPVNKIIIGVINKCEV